ncbi:MAG: dTDP-glucose 4,6-dehydratase [Verrucomicrobiales bacterium]|jgi:dTDP-glucose 4,6-dehydratase|nr:dTDP-glucose 4,6-dehydratase [Verrucomicrobiales bacterium]
MNRLLVTGAAGFIGSSLVRNLLKSKENEVIAVDKLTYAGNLRSLDEISGHPGFQFFQEDICDRSVMAEIFSVTSPTGVIHLAAESHVDRSIDDPSIFLETNVMGTFSLLETCRHFLSQRTDTERSNFRFHHVSTDEVYGDLGKSGGSFSEGDPYLPSSPYAASKASSDHLVRSWGRTYGIPFVITNCSNNYGPRQFPEKLIPHTILNALSSKPLPIYGDGTQIRDWLYVEDHVSALIEVFFRGNPGETYHIGGNSTRQNLEVVQTICQTLEKHAANRKPEGVSRYVDLIRHVSDRPGHDLCYSMDTAKIQSTLGWAPQETFSSGMEKTVLWYLENETWWQSILSGEYLLERIGTLPTAE